MYRYPTDSSVPQTPPSMYQLESRRRPSDLDYGYSSPVGYPETTPYVPFNAVPTPPIHDNTGASSSVHYGPSGTSAHFGPDPPYHHPPQQQHSELGLAPARQLRRYNTKKRVQLVRGNLVLDCPCPTRLLQAVPRKDAKEFTHMRYTAATCDPSEFAKDYTLRQALLGRSTELFIAITMYNEDEVLFTRTMHGVMKNIAYLCTRERSRTWGVNGWQKVTVCVIADGRTKIHPRTLAVLGAMGVYQEGIAKNKVQDKEVTAHIYEYTTQLSVDSNLKFKGADKDIVPTQIIFCLKEKNAKKINSHRWFFQAFGPIIQPNICVLLDVGTRPGNTSIYHLWKTFDVNSNVAGACGEIRAMTGPAGVHLLNPLVAAQNFEYKISNILDKPLESVFGYISVLPGAFSAYRYIALQNDMNGHGPLEKYFLGETLHGGIKSGIFEANMYLAEDRILCYELIAKKDQAWILKYVSSAYGETDVPNSVPEFISQRRRWLNGSFFAGIYALWHWGKIFQTAHSTGRKFALLIENIYLTINLLFSWFAIGQFFLSFFILTQSLVTVEPPPFSPTAANIVHQILTYVYLILIIVLFLIAMGNRPQGSKAAYIGCFIFFALLMVYIMFCSIWLAYVGVQSALTGSAGSLLSNGAFRDIVVSVCATYALYFVASLMFLDPWHMFTSFGQYIFLMPSYINVLNVYAFCNTHDVSWGTKAQTGVATDLGVVATAQNQETVEVHLPTEQKDINALYEETCLELQKKRIEEKSHRDARTKQEDYYRAFRTRLVVCWIISNLVLAIVVANATILQWLGDFNTRTNAYFAFILWSVAVLAAFRFLGSLTYRITGLFTLGVIGSSSPLYCSTMLSASRLTLARLSIVFGTSILTVTHGSPINFMDDDTADVGSAGFWTRFGVIIGLVLMGGLTLGLMGLDETNLQVLMVSGTEAEKKNAHKVYRLLDRGKHWVLVTLLMSNVIVNETLPIILDSVFGGGWQAVVISTALIVIFGEVIPQSICVRHGLAIGAKTSEMVLVLMYIMWPIAYPTALLLDYFLGESHGTVYKKAGLKTLVSLHKAADENNDVDALTDDEVTIIGAVLDLRAKPVSKIMTPIADCFTLSLDAKLDEKVMDQIVSAGYSRIPVHSPGSKTNFVGMLLVKQLIKYDPEDAEPVSSFQISNLPETGPDTSCLDILNFFQEGRSHMALVSNDPGGDTGVLGVITLEDVIEELIGEEIIDETDVYVDVHQKIKVVRRTANKHNIRLFPFLASRRRMSKDLRNDKIVASKNLKRTDSTSKPADHQDIETRIKGYGAVLSGSMETESATFGAVGESQPLINNSNKS